MIVVVHPSDELYGADRVLLSVVARLRDRDDVEVWLPNDVAYPERLLSRELKSMGIAAQQTDLPVLRRAYANPRDVTAVLKRARNFAARLGRTNPDGLYVNTSALAPAVPIAAARGIPSTLHVHETWGIVERSTLTKLCTPADLIVTVGSATRRSLPETLRRRAVIRRHSVAAMPVDPEEVARIRQQCGLSDQDVLVSFAGRWTPGKGIRELLQAAVAARNPRLRLLILGGPPPSGESVNASELVAEMGLESSTTIIGEVDDVWPYIYASDAVAVPSVKPESYPTIALEAIAAGRPVLASDIGGLPEIVVPGRGVLVPPGDLAAWSQTLGDLRRDSDLTQ